jgi:hypothetical protein
MPIWGPFCKLSIKTKVGKQLPHPFHVTKSVPVPGVRYAAFWDLFHFGTGPEKSSVEPRS